LVRCLKPPVFLAVLVCVTGNTHAQSIDVVSAASFTQSVSAGSIVSIFGANLATQTAFASDAANPPRRLGGVTVTIGGKSQLARNRSMGVQASTIFPDPGKNYRSRPPFPLISL
jgi:hypothetical protein